MFDKIKLGDSTFKKSEKSACTYRLTDRLHSYQIKMKGCK